VGEYGIDADTIVVGAGISGLTTARLLTQRGQRVLVLEARERIGGRVSSEREGGVTTDVGASWIHGIVDNSVYDAARAFGMRMHEFTVGSYQAGSRPIAYYCPDGERLDDAARDAFVNDIAEFDRRLEKTIAASETGDSYGDVVERTLDALDWDRERAARVREYMQHRTEEQYGAYITELDAHGLDDDAFEGDEVVFPDGFGELATHLADGLDIRLDHEVTRVEWQTSPGTVTVTSRHGRFVADRAIVTVPVGVLRSDDFTFSPPLPDTHLAALAGLRMNAFEKVFVSFDAKFWDDDVYAIRRQGPAAAWWHSWYDLTGLHGEPTLLTFAAGPAAQETRSWSDDDITESVLNGLREIYGEAVTSPTRVRITRWQDDPYTRGSYAFMTVGSKPEDHDLLAEPIGDGVLHLAGETTWTDDPATVTAALMSGHRAAERVLGHPVPIEELWR